MKKILTVVLLGLGLSQVNAQKIEASEVPNVVKTGFAKEYPTVRDVKWDKEGNAFEASFDHNKMDMSVLLDETGMIKETETEIKEKELPKAIKETLKKDFVGYKIEEVAKILSSGITTYEVEVEKADLSFDVIFNAQGKVLKKEEKNKEDKD